MNTPKPFGKVNSYRDLVVWQKSRSLATEAYRICMTPSFERHRGLADQIMRSAVSIPSNIAEGDERGTNKDALRFLLIARGSLAELETQLNIAEDLGILHSPAARQIATQLDEVDRLLGGTIKMRKAREEKAGCFPSTLPLVHVSPRPRSQAPCYARLTCITSLTPCTLCVHNASLR